MQSMYVLGDIMKNTLFSMANVRFLGVANVRLANVSHSPAHIFFNRLFLSAYLLICFIFIFVKIRLPQLTY